MFNRRPCVYKPGQRFLKVFSEERHPDDKMLNKTHYESRLNKTFDVTFRIGNAIQTETAAVLMPRFIEESYSPPKFQKNPL